MKYILKNPWLLIIVIPAWILNLLPTFFDGQYGCVNNECGYILGSNFGDGSWFKAVTAVSFQNFPFQMPNYAGEILKGYHYLPNLIAFIFTKAGIPFDFTIHKLFPLIYLSLITVILINLANIIGRSTFFVFIFLFFYFFGMHLSIFTSIYHFGEIRNGALINTFQSTRILESPHLALALIGMFYILFLLYKESGDGFKNNIKIGIILFLIVGTKFYVAFSTIIILAFHGLLKFIENKNIKSFLLKIVIYSSFLIVSIFLFYNPLSSTSSGNIFTFSPFTTTFHLIESPDLFYWNDVVLARYFLEENGLSPRLISIYLFTSLLFFIYYFGTRFIGFFYFLNINKVKSLSITEKAISISILLSCILSITLLQKGDWYNPIQFAVPAAFLLNIFVAKFLYQIYKNYRLISIFLIPVLMMLTLIANLVNLNYINSSSRVVISFDEKNALDFLKNQPFGTIFTPPQKNDAPYIAAYSEKPLFANFFNTLENAGIDFSERKKIYENKFLPNKNQIDYIYLKKLEHNDYLHICNNKNINILLENDVIIICKYEKI
jgi:hypothetical protein